MAEWIEVAKVSELPSEGIGHSVKADGLQIALFQWENGVFAIENLCPHLGFPLSEGIVQFGEVICGWHGWRVDLQTGSCHSGRNGARVFPCEVRGDAVFVQV